MCHIIEIFWFQTQTFCSQALNSLLTAEYLVECVTGRARVAKNFVQVNARVCARVCVCVSVCVLDRSGGWQGRALVKGCAIASSQETSKTHSPVYTHTHTHTHST